MKRYAISDIHGNFRAFERLLDYVDPDPEELVILGDLGDRGLQTWEVYEECAMLIDEGTDIVMGNHDIWLMQFLNKKITEQFFTSEEVGGITTLKSIELAINKHGQNHVQDVLSRVFDAMKPYYEDDNFIFVHAGLDPRIPYMNQQKVDTLLMGCKEWSNPTLDHSYDQFVVFGHTPTFRIHKAIDENDARVWTSNRARKIAIDTGSGFGCRLTMVDLIDGIAYAYDFMKRDIIEYQFRRRVRLS